MNSVNKILIIVLSIFIFTDIQSQDIHFSQFYEQPILRNPALAGIFTGDIRFTGSFRNQWQSVTDPYRTYGLSGEIKFPAPHLPNDNVTFGFQLVSDVAGTSRLSNTQFLPALNFHKSLNENNANLSAAIMAGFIQEKFDPTKAILNDQYVSSANGSFSILPASNQVFDKTNVSYYDMSAGISYSNKTTKDVDYYLGVGVFHVTRPSVGFFYGNQVRLNPKYVVNFGLAAPTSDDDEVDFYADFYKQGGHNTFQGGLMYNHNFLQIDDDRKGIKAGVVYRWNDAIIPIIQLQLSNVSISTSYDINVSQLVKASQSRGGLEIKLSYSNFLNFRNTELRASRCPRFGGSGMPTGDYRGY